MAIKKPIKLTIYLSYSQGIVLLRQLTEQIEYKTWPKRDEDYK